jgi:hypothetical protein
MSCSQMIHNFQVQQRLARHAKHDNLTFECLLQNMQLLVELRHQLTFR